MQTRLAIVLALLFSVPLLVACDLLDDPCPEGYWRPMAMEACVPVPSIDAGSDAGTDAGVDAAIDAGDGDAGDGDASMDAATGDAGPLDAAAGDAAIDGSASDASDDGG